MANEVTVKATALLLAAAFLIALLAVGSTPVTTLPDFYRNLWATTHPGDRVSVAAGAASRNRPDSNAISPAAG
jgi:hypothetical protein